MTIPRAARILGVHRALFPPGALPQAAEVLDADPTRRHPEEIHVAAETLNIDSASMRQLEEEQGGDPARVGARILEIVRQRGKMHNPTTGSGGMLTGRVAWIGEGANETAARCGVSIGDKVATLVSLTLTPLHLERVRSVDLATHQVDVEGTAVIFASGTLARMPDDLPERLALALFDVAGASPQVERMTRPGDRVLILGAGGKSGLLCAVAARRRGARVVGVEAHPAAAVAARAVGGCEVVLEQDARDPIATATAATAVVPEGYDLVVSCVNVEGAEMAAILAARPRGRIYFFSMATSFTRAALGAEGVARDVDMLIGNGYCEAHARETLALVRDHAPLREELARRVVAVR